MNTREKPNIFIRSICIALSAILFVTNVVGAQAQKPSDDFWAERQKTVKAAREYAQLPDNPSVSPFIKGRDRGIIPDITGIEAKAKQQSPGNIPNLIVKNGPSWLRSLPYAYATLEDYYESPRKDSPTVIFVQDVHGHYEAQQNIANIINNIAEAQGTEVRRPKSEDRNLKTNGRYRSSVIGPRSSVVVGLEGAVGAFDFSPYRAFPNKEINKEIADYFLKSGLISGPEYVGLVSDIEPMFWGVEDKDTYLANIEAFKESLPLRDNAKKQIETAARRLVDLKRKVYSPEMLSLDEKIEGYHNGTLGLGEYLGYLSSIPSFSKGGLGRIMNNPPNVNLFLEVFKTEKTLDFNKVEDERRILIEKLVNVLGKEELESLVYQAVAHRMGNIENSAYYHELEKVCQKHALRLSNWPELARYVRYSIGADKIDRRALFGEINRLEEDVVAQFTGGEALSSFRIGRRSTTPDESGNYTTAAMEVYETSKYISLVSKLIDNNLTDEEWKEYEKLGARDLGLGTSNNTPKKLASSPQPLVPVVKSFEKFYEVATSRNKILIENLLTKIGEPKTDGRKPKSDFGLQTSVFGLAVLVAGGFHTQAMAKLLKDKQISYAILSPKLTEIDPTKGTQYLEAFAQDRTPLDKLMLGEKIFLSAFRSMGQVPGGIAHEFESNVAMRSNFYSALEAGLNLDELLSQTKASQSEANKIINGLQKLIENKLPFIKTIRFLNYAKTRDGGTVLPMLINDGQGFAVEIHPKGWASRKVTVAGMVDGELAKHSFKIRSLKLGERLSFQVPPLLPETIKTASAWALFSIVPKETLEMAIKSTGSAGFNIWLAVTIGILAVLIGISIAYRIYKYRLNQAKETSRDKSPVPITAPKKTLENIQELVLQEAADAPQFNTASQVIHWLVTIWRKYETFYKFNLSWLTGRLDEHGKIPLNIKNELYESLRPIQNALWDNDKEALSSLLEKANRKNTKGITVTENDAKLTLKELLDKKELMPMVEGGATVIVVKRGKPKRKDWVVRKGVKAVFSYQRKLKPGDKVVITPKSTGGSEKHEENNPYDDKSFYQQLLTLLPLLIVSGLAMGYLAFGGTHVPYTDGLGVVGVMLSINPDIQQLRRNLINTLKSLLSKKATSQESDSSTLHGHDLEFTSEKAKSILDDLDSNDEEIFKGAYELANQYVARLNNIKGIMFDFGGVLANLNLTADERKSNFERFFNALNFEQHISGINRSEKMTILKNIYRQFREEHKDDYIKSRRGLIPFDDYVNLFNNYLEEHNIHLKLTPRDFAFLFMHPSFKGEARFKDILLGLKNKYKLYVLSDQHGPGSNWSEPEAVDHTLEEYYPGIFDEDNIFRSYKTGYSKHYSEAFSGVLEKIGLTTEEVVFVDDLDELTSTARNLGILTSTVNGDDPKLQEIFLLNELLHGQWRKSVTEKLANRIIAKTRDVYDTIAPAYALIWQSDPDITEYISTFLKRLPEKGVVLDAGTGTGRNAAWFLAEGRDAIGIDLSLGQLIDARKQHSESPLMQMDLRYLAFQSGTMAGVWDNTTFHHIPSVFASQVLEEYRRVLRDDGLLFIRVKRGDTEGDEYDPNYNLYRYFKRYQETELRELLSAHGFEVIESGEQTTSRDVFVYLFARPTSKGIRPLLPEETLPNTNVIPMSEDSSVNRQVDVNVPQFFNRHPAADIKDLKPEYPAGSVQINKQPFLKLLRLFDVFALLKLNVKRIRLFIKRDIHNFMLVSRWGSIRRLSSRGLIPFIFTKITDWPGSRLARLISIFFWLSSGSSSTTNTSNAFGGMLSSSSRRLRMNFENSWLISRFFSNNSFSVIRRLPQNRKPFIFYQNLKLYYKTKDIISNSYMRMASSGIRSQSRHKRNGFRLHKLSILFPHKVVNTPHRVI